MSAIELLCDAIRHGDDTVTIHNLILRRDLNISHQDSKGYTPLLLACKYGRKTVFNLLIEYGAKVDHSECPFHRTLLHYASGCGWIEIVHFLMKRVHILSSEVHRDIIRCEDIISANIHAWDREGRTAMHFAACNGHLEVVKCLLEEGANLDTGDRREETALHVASEKGHLEIVKFLLEKGASVEAKSKFGETALHKASNRGHVEVVKFLVKKGGDLDARYEDGIAAMHLAARHGHLEVLKCLVEEGANLDTSDNSAETALHEASEKGHLELVKFLLEKGANIEANNKWGETALHKASIGGHLEVVKFLVKKGGDLDARNEDGIAAMHLAARHGHLEVLKCLVEEGANLDTSDKSAETALHEASQEGHLELVKFLLEKGANIEAKTKCGETALHKASDGGHLEVVKFLVAKGGDLNTRNEDGQTAMHKASAEGNLEVVKHLLDKGADIEVNSNYGTPLLTAVQYLSYDVTVFLINSGAKVDCCDGRKCTVLHFASQHGWLDLVQYLVKRVPVSDFILERDSIDSCEAITCSTIHAIDIDGRTALGYASFCGIIEVVKFLVTEGADLNVRNKHGRTALYEASANGFLKVVKYLVESGADINTKCCEGGTPLLAAAAISNHEYIVSLLVNSGANVDDFDKSKKTVLHYALRRQWTSIVESIVKKMTNLDAKDSNGETALLYACRFGQLKSAKNLLQAGARWDIGKNGRLPLNYICGNYPLEELINLFIAVGAYLEPDNYYRILNNPYLKLLQDVTFCCQAIINKYNVHDLSALYELPVAASLPRINKMVIASNSEVSQTIERTVILEIQKNGHCNVLEARPMALSFFCVRSVLEYYDNKKSSVLPKRLKRAASSDPNSDYQHLSKSMRLN